MNNIYNLNVAFKFEKVAAICDAVVVGSALVHKMEQLADRPDEIPAAISSIIQGMRHAIDGDDRIVIGLMP